MTHKPYVKPKPYDPVEKLDYPYKVIVVEDRQVRVYFRDCPSGSITCLTVTKGTYQS